MLKQEKKILKLTEWEAAGLHLPLAQEHKVPVPLRIERE